MYSEKVKIRYSHLSPTGKTGLLSLLNFFSGCGHRPHKWHKILDAQLICTKSCVDTYFNEY